MIKTINVRAFKDQLSACLRDVQHGNLLLITHRGRVVAELRRPEMGTHVADALLDRRQRLIDAGILRAGLPNDAAVYRRKAAARLPAAVIDAALADTREDR